MLSGFTRVTSWPEEPAMGAFSAALVVSALGRVLIGRLLDRYGPRLVMTAGSVAGVVATWVGAGAPSVPGSSRPGRSSTSHSRRYTPQRFAALTRWYGHAGSAR